MSETICTEAKNLPDFLLKKFRSIKKGQYVKIIKLDENIEYDDEGNVMPPESAIKQEWLAKELKEDENYDRSQNTILETEADIDKFFAEIQSE